MFPAAVCVHAIPSVGMTIVISGQQRASFAQVGAPPSPPPVEEPASSAVPPEEPLPDPLLDPLEEPLDPLDPPEDPLPEPLEEPPSDAPEEPPSLSTGAAPSSPVPKPPAFFFDEHATRSTRTLPDAQTNPPIFSIAVSSSYSTDRPNAGV